MLISYEFFNYISLFLYGVGAYMGIKCWVVGGELFCKGDIRNIFKGGEASEAEWLYLIVAIGVFGNISFVRAFIGYIIEYNGHATGGNEIYFVGGHILTGLIMVFWHDYALKRIILLRKRLGRCKTL